MLRKAALPTALTVFALLAGAGAVQAVENARPPTAPFAAPVGTAFTYQGYLADGGAQADGTYDFQFKLFDDASAGLQVGGIVSKDDVDVAEGYFTVELDLGAVFDGTALWLEIGVRPGASTGGYQQLLPRQPLTAVPYANYALAAPWSGLSGVPAGFADGSDDDTTYSAGTGLTLSGGAFSLTTPYRLPQGCANSEIPKWNGSAWVCAADANSGGDITAVNAGTGLTGGGTSGAVTMNVNFAGSGSATTVARSDQDHWGQTWSGSGIGLTLSGGSTGLNSSGLYYGVLGNATAATDDVTFGVYGTSNSTSGRGVDGYADAPSGYTYGVYGQSDSISGSGIYGLASATSGTTYGVYSWSNSTSGYDFYAGGPGTNYGPFTGAHEVRLAASFPLDVKAGMIVSATGEAQARHGADGGVEISSTLPTVRLADTAEDKAVFGALVSEVTLPEDHWYEAGEDERFASVNALGEGRVWVSSINGGIEAGDYITTSALPGYGQRQNDDLLHSYTLGKATETVHWDKVTETVMYNGQEYKVYLIAVVYTSG